MSPRSRRTRSQPLRLAVVCTQLEVGGQETGLVNLLRGLDRRRFTPIVYSFRDGPLAVQIRALRIRIHVGAPRARSRRWTNADARAKVRFRRTLAEAMRADRIDVCLVYAHPDAINAAREAGVPAIVERLDGPKLIAWVRDKSSCASIICESAALKRMLLAQSDMLRSRSVPIAVIPNGVDLSRFEHTPRRRSRARAALRLPARAFVVGTVARLDPVKNLGHLIQAARLLVDRTKAERRPLRFVLAGPDNGAGAALRQQVRDLGLNAYVRFLGARADVPKVLSALDVFVLTSFQEGVPFSLLEAMATGLPVVAPQSDSIAEVVRNNGYLVGPLDPLRTTLALREMLAHEALHRTLGRRSRQLAHAYDLDRMIRRYQRLLEQAFRRGTRNTALERRRVAIVSGHPPQTIAGRTMAALFETLTQYGVNAFLLGTAPHASRGRTHWPPPKRQSFPDTEHGERRRRAALDWIQPDLVVTDCPQVVAAMRRALPGEEIVFMPRGDDACTGRFQALRTANRVLVESLREKKELVRRWPQFEDKVHSMTRATAVRTVLAVR